MQYLYDILMNGDILSVILLAKNVSNADHLISCLTYCLHEGKNKMSPAVPKTEREKQLSSLLSFIAVSKMLHVLTPCVTGEYFMFNGPCIA